MAIEKQRIYWHDLSRVSTIQEVSDMWEVSIKAVMLWIDTGKIAAYQRKEGENWIVSLQSVIDFRGAPKCLTPKTSTKVSKLSGL